MAKNPSGAAFDLKFPMRARGDQCRKFQIGGTSETGIVASLQL
jgi:hypothetical protein